MKTDTQRRAVCPACFREQAIRANGTMVQHGYTRPQGWHQNVGDCYGTGKPNFGTKEGRAVTAEVIRLCHNAAKNEKEMASKVRAGTLPVLRNGVAVVNPTQRERDSEAERHERNAKYAANDAHGFQRRYDAWTPKAPRTVKVVRKGPVVHLDTGRGGRPECAGPYYTGLNAILTQDRAKVTCTRCIKHFPWVDARAKRAKANG